MHAGPWTRPQEVTVYVNLAPLGRNASQSCHIPQDLEEGGRMNREGLRKERA